MNLSNFAVRKVIFLPDAPVRKYRWRRYKSTRFLSICRSATIIPLWLHLAGLTYKLMPSSGCPFIHAEKRWLELVRKCAVKSVGRTSLYRSMPTLPCKHYISIGGVTVVIVLVERCKHLVDMLFGDSNGYLPICLAIDPLLP